MAYEPRIVDAELRGLLSAVGFVVVEGPRAVGKTETARQVARSEVLLDIDANARSLAAADPGLLLPGDAPRLIDEWQLAPSIWNHVRREVDKRSQPGQFILTGSAVPSDDETRHSGAGRVARLRMRPMTLLESGQSSGEVSLGALLEGDPPHAVDAGLTVSRVIELICTGGWPQLAKLEPGPAQAAMRAYLDEISRADVQRVDGIRRDPARMSRVLGSLARHTASSASARTLAADTAGADEPMDRETVSDYVAALERLMIVEDVPAWAPTLRSRARLRSTATRHFVDPTLAVAALRGSPKTLLNDLELVGWLFESLVVRDLRVYLQREGAMLRTYRDSNGLEVDVILEVADGRWAAIEVKLGSGQVDKAAATLRRFAEVVDTSRIGEPTFLGVVTATGYGYRRPDGVYVLPIGTLGP